VITRTSSTAQAPKPVCRDPALHPVRGGTVLLAAAAFISACGLQQGTPGGLPKSLSEALVSPAFGSADHERITVIGTRISMGNAVDCSQIRTDDGKTYSISYLAPSIEIGDRVSVTGFFANVVECRGTVLYAETVVVLGKQ